MFCIKETGSALREPEHSAPALGDSQDSLVPEMPQNRVCFDVTSSSRIRTVALGSHGSVLGLRLPQPLWDAVGKGAVRRLPKTTIQKPNVPIPSFHDPNPKHFSGSEPPGHLQAMQDGQTWQLDGTSTGRTTHNIP